MIYIINIFKTEFIFTRYIRVKKYGKVIKIFNILTIVSLIFMMIKCNPVTIIIFNFVQAVAKPYTSLINSNNLLAVSNQKGIKEGIKKNILLFMKLYICR